MAEIARIVVYGFVCMLSALPHLLIPEMVGARLARYVLEKRCGQRPWRQYAPVLLAGYAGSMGLNGMSAVAIDLEISDKGAVLALIPRLSQTWQSRPDPPVLHGDVATDAGPVDAGGGTAGRISG